MWNFFFQKHCPAVENEIDECSGSSRKVAFKVPYPKG
jgi:hypothetical protein